jgi:hypothetical protein
VQTRNRRTALFAGVIAASLLGLSSIGVSAQDAETAQVRVLHASPDAPAVDVYVDGAAVLTNIGFGALSSYLEVPAGDHQVQVFAAGADPAVDAAVIDATVPLAAGSASTIAATNSIESIEAQVIADTPAPVADAVQVRVVHLSADTPPVDIAPDGGDEIIQALAYPSATEYLTVPAGQLDVEVRPAGAVDGWVVANPGGVFLSDGKSYSLFAVGSLAEDNFRLVTGIDASVPPPGPAQVRVLHGSPDAPAVDVYVDGALAFSGAAFGQITDYAEIPAGDHQVQVVAAGTTPADGTVIDATLTFAPDSATTVAATGDLANLTPQVIVDDPTPSADAAQLRVVHLISDAPAVAIYKDGAKKPMIKKLAYPNASRYTTQKGGEIDLEIKLVDGGATALDLDPLTLEAGTSTSAFAIGTLASGTITVVTALDASAS